MPAPHPQYMNHGPQEICDCAATNDNNEQLDAQGERCTDTGEPPLRCTAKVWSKEYTSAASRPCCKGGKAMLPPIPMPPDPAFKALYDANSRIGYDSTYHARALNHKFTYSMMGSTTGTLQRGWHYHGQPQLSFFKLHGLTYHSISLRNAKEPWRNWTVAPCDTHPNQRLTQAVAITGSMIQSFNHLHGDVQRLRESLAANPAQQEVNLIFRGPPGTTAGAPATNEMANIAVGPHGQHPHGYHVCTMKRNADGEFRNWRVYPGSPYFMELQYPVLFPTGHGGWYNYTEKVYQTDDDGNPVLLDGRRVVESQTRHVFRDVQVMPTTPIVPHFHLHPRGVISHTSNLRRR